MSPAETFEAVDQALIRAEGDLRAGRDLGVQATVDEAIAWVSALMAAYGEMRSGVAIDSSRDVLDVFREFVKGDPSLNAVRDNVRELVYYRNCLAASREDALPRRPAAMAIRTARHIYLYLRTRQIKESDAGHG